MTLKTKRKELSDTLNQEKKLQSLRTMYFNRFLLIRYFLALFFFADFYWLFLSLGDWTSAVVGALFLLAIVSAFEMFRVMAHPYYDVNWTKYFFRAQAIVSIGFAALLTLMPVHQLLPFFTDTSISRIIGNAFFLTSFGLSIVANKRLEKIATRTDRQHARIENYKKVLRLNL